MIQDLRTEVVTSAREGRPQGELEGRHSRWLTAERNQLAWTIQSKKSNPAFSVGLRRQLAMRGARAELANAAMLQARRAAFDSDSAVDVGAGPETTELINQIHALVAVARAAARLSGLVIDDAKPLRNSPLTEQRERERDRRTNETSRLEGPARERPSDRERIAVTAIHGALAVAVDTATVLAAARPAAAISLADPGIGVGTGLD